MARRPVHTLAEPHGNQPLGAVRAAVDRFGDHYYRPPFVLVEEWSTADSEYFACRMPNASVVAAWVRDAEGFRPITEQERVERYDQNPQPGAFTLVQFFIESDGKHVVMAVFFGPKAAHGGRYQVASGPSGPVLVGEDSWVS